MDIKYRYAVLSFCMDLTSPSSRSQPIGLLAIAESENSAFVLSITRAFPGEDTTGIGNDPFSKRILNNFQSFISEQLEQGLEEAGPAGFLPWLQDRLRNTIHVSTIGQEKSVVHVSQEELPMGLMNDFMKIFKREVIQPLQQPTSGKHNKSEAYTEAPAMQVRPLPREPMAAAM